MDIDSSQVRDGAQQSKIQISQRDFSILQWHFEQISRVRIGVEDSGDEQLAQCGIDGHFDQCQVLFDRVSGCLNVGQFGAFDPFHDYWMQIEGMISNKDWNKTTTPPQS